MARLVLKKRLRKILEAAAESYFDPNKPKVTMHGKNHHLLRRLVNWKLVVMDLETKTFVPTELGLDTAIRYRSGGGILALDRKLATAGVDDEA